MTSVRATYPASGACVSVSVIAERVRASRLPLPATRLSRYLHICRASEKLVSDIFEYFFVLISVIFQVITIFFNLIYF